MAKLLRREQIEELKEGLLAEAGKVRITPMMDIASIGTIQSVLWTMYKASLITQNEHKAVATEIQTAWDCLHARKKETVR